MGKNREILESMNLYSEFSNYEKERSTFAPCSKRRGLTHYGLTPLSIYTFNVDKANEWQTAGQ
jgi:hypothetical protein